MVKHIEALAAVLIRHTHSGVEIGVFRRTAKRTIRPHMYEVAMGGEFNPGDTPQIVLRRELQEKTQLQPQSITKAGYTDIQDEKILIRRHIFVCELQPFASPQIDTSKHEEFAWRTLEDITTMKDLSPGTWEILKQSGLQTE